ncbi:MAG: hypothetical protein SO044_02780 [Agathobaculum sp.]|nr:hypothetical protein [Agathobaculum sp.]MDY3711321.1 hypothetical protein [Agathobaculum sp.]
MTQTSAPAALGAAGPVQMSNRMPERFARPPAFSETTPRKSILSNYAVLS